MIRPVLGKPLYKEQIGIEEYWSDQNIQLYPNPATETIYYSINNSIELTGIRLIDITGKLLYQNSSVQSNQLDISQYSQGIYFMQFLSKGSTLPITKKFIVSR
jgi:hypothetical protein